MNASLRATYDFRKGNQVICKYADGVEVHNWRRAFQTPKH